MQKDVWKEIEELNARVLVLEKEIKELKKEVSKW